MATSTVGSPPSIRDARREMYRAQVLAAAEIEFARSGFPAARVSVIARSANVSLATLYKNFAGKEEIWDALHELRMAQAVAAAVESSSAGATALDRLLLASHGVVLFFAEQSYYLELNVKSGLGWATADDDEHGQGSQKRSWRTGRDILTQAAEVAARDGQLQPLKPELVAQIIIASQQLWLTDWLKADRDRAPAEVADELVDHLRRTLAVPPASDVG